MVGLRDVHALCHIVDQLKNRAKVRGPVQVHPVDGIFIGLDDSFDPVALRIENVSIKSKAVVRLLLVGRNGCPKAQHWDLLVRVVVLQDAANRLYGIQVLVLLHVKVMQGVWFRGMSIGRGKINGNLQRYFAPAKDKVEE